MKLQCQIIVGFWTNNKMVYQKSRLLDIYPHAIANDVSKYKMTASMYTIGAWKLLNLQNYVKKSNTL
jgi:hypothetical protein